MSDDLVVVVLQGGYTRAEQTLIAAGQNDTVIESRLAMKQAIEEVGISTIERLTGRRVRSFMSASDPRQQIQAEVFQLEQEPLSQGQEADLEFWARAAREENTKVREELRALRAEQIQSRSALRRYRQSDR
jgi:uncharacterized protein YbcI